MERQMTLAELNDELGAARTNKKEFLDKLESIIPWDNFIKIIHPSHYKGELGNKPYPLELMLRIFILQNVYNLADMAVMNEVRTSSNR
jgi:IS5 family transposase